MTDTHQIQFNNYLVDFIQKLQKILPKEKKLLSKYYKYYRTFVDNGKRVDFIGEFIQYIAKYDKEVSTCDEGLFSEEEGYYPNKPIQLMKGIDFKRIWRNENLTEGSKTNIWKYLQTLYLIGTFVLKETNKYKKLLKQQQEIIYNLMQSMKYEKQIKDDAEKQNQSETDNNSSGFDLNGLGELFNEDNIITQIAMEIAKEINLSGNLGSDPIQAMRMLFGQDSSKLQEVIGKVQQKLTTVLRDKGVTENDLIKQAEQMKDKVFSKLKGIPGMANIEKLSQQLADNLEKTKTNTSTQDPGQKEQFEKEQLANCQSTIRELTENLKKNMTEMGINNLGDFQKNLESVMSQVNNVDNVEKNDNDNDNDDELQKELDNLKKKFAKK